MTKERPSLDALCHSCQMEQGFLLFEVLAAVVVLSLMAVFLVSMAASLASASAALRTEQQPATATDSAEKESTEANGKKAWCWGEQVQSVSWNARGELKVAVSDDWDLPAGGADSGCYKKVGLWIDGWFKGEFLVNNGEAALPPECWKSGLPQIASAGHEVVLRVHKVTGSWGAPWRITVSEVSDGETQGASFASCSETSGGDLEPAAGQSPDWAAAVVHIPFLSTAGLHTTGLPCTVADECKGLLRTISPAGEGVVTVELEGQSQSWLVEIGRSLDVYF
ncbi:MAG: hypothetical protein N3B14_05885 [Thermoleophilia bacterium]|nr:hypothetical protein [Thermoleophilia bacterium]